MMKKIIGFIICTLLITTSGFSVAEIDENRNGLNINYSASNIENSPPPTGIFEWPMFHHYLNNTGYSPSLAPDDDNILWSKDIAYDLKSNPTIKDDKLYIVDNTLDPLGRGGDIYCFNPFTGEEIWKTDQLSDEVWGSPTVANGRVYVLGMYFNLYCYDAYTGDELWRFEAWGHCSPMVVDDKVYFGCSHGDKEGFYCLNASTGEQIWVHDPITSYDGCTPAIVDEMVYIASTEGILYCLDAETGDEIWNSPNKCGWASPAVFNDKVYTNYDKVYCLDAGNGDELWNYPIGDSHSSPAVAYGYVYIPDNDGSVYALDADTGELIWQSSMLGTSIWNAPAVADDKVYIASNNVLPNPGYFNCLDAFTGEIIWQYTFTATHIYSSPAIAYGNIYIGSVDGYFYAFGTPNEPPEKPTKPEGPDNGLFDIEYLFNSSSTDPEDDDIYYLFDWGDGNYSSWIGPYASGEEVSASHIWTDFGYFDIRIKAHDGRRESGWSEPLTINITTLPPDAPDIDGPKKGKKDVSYNFTFNSVDPDGDYIHYFINWGDGFDTGWIGPYPSGVDIDIVHTYKVPNICTIEAKSRDVSYAESNWSYFDIKIPRTKATTNVWYQWFLEHFPLLEKLLNSIYKK